MEDPNALNIYTDGSSLPNPRRGGVGFVFVLPEHLNKPDLSFCPPGHMKATNNQMEIMACVYALQESLKMQKSWQRIVIHTDSLYVCENYRRAYSLWSRNGWTLAGGAPVANIAAWKELLKVISKLKCSVDFCWVKGHKDSANNKLADKLAKQSSRKASLKPLNNMNLRRKTSSKKTERGSVEMLGQKIKIRIINSMSQSKQIKTYRYEVTSKGSEFFDCVDVIHSPTALGAGHELLVRLNKDHKFPQIVKVYRDYTGEKKISAEKNLLLKAP